MLTWRLLWRDWRSGELRILLVALVLAVTIVSSIGMFIERLHGGIVNRSSHFLAADRVLKSPRPIDEAWLQQATDQKLKIAKTIMFQSMIRSEEIRSEEVRNNGLRKQTADGIRAEPKVRMQLAAVKAVDSAYPLQGTLRISEESFAGDIDAPHIEIVEHGPQVGEVWLDSTLLPLLNVGIGSQIFIGDASLRIAKVLLSEPDRSMSAFDFGPRVLMHWRDLAATAIVQPGSQVSYKYLFSGADKPLNDFSVWLEPLMDPSHKWIDLKEEQPRIASAIQRARGFLLLGGSLGVLLASIAVSLAAHRFSDRHLDYVALMKSLGASSGRIKTIYIANLLLVALVSIIIGWFIGWLAQHGFVAAIAQLIPYDLPNPSISPLLLGALTGIICLFSFALPPIWGLQKVPPLRVLRRDIGAGERNYVFTGILGFFAIVTLMTIYSQDINLTLAVVAGVLVAAVVLGGSAFVILRSTISVGMHAGGVMGLTLANLRRRGLQNAFQILIFALAIMMFLMLFLVRTTLLEEWRLQLPEGTPNHFLVNVADDEVDSINQWFANKDIVSQPMYPMVRGRLTYINELRLEDISTELQREMAGVERELNMTWMQQLPEDNELLAGSWWLAGTNGAVANGKEEAEVSVESSLAKNLDITVGDHLTFQIASHEFSATVSSIRKLRWDRMSPNFYVIFSPQVLSSFPASYMTSFYLPITKKTLLVDFLQKYPTVTLLEMDAIILQIRTIVKQVSMAIELVLGLIVSASLLVLVASVFGSLDERFRESAILRTLGASRRLVLGSLVLEFAVLGMVAGVFAVIGAECSVYFLQVKIFLMVPSLHPQVWLAGPMLGIFLVTLIGYFSTRKVVETPPLQVLNQL